jgi:hypothetical protein
VAAAEPDVATVQRKLDTLDRFKNRIIGLVTEVFPDATPGQCTQMWVGMLLTFDKAGIEMYVRDPKEQS